MRVGLLTEVVISCTIVTILPSENLAGHLTVDTVFDGNCLHSDGSGDGERSGVQTAVLGRRTAVNGVADLGSVRSGDSHLDNAMEGSITADYRRLYGLRLGSFAGAATLAAVRPVWIGSVSIAGVAALVLASPRD